MLRSLGTRLRSVGLWKIRVKNGDLKLQCLAVMDLVTRWIETAEVFKNDAENIALVFDHKLLLSYPRLLRCIHDQGTKFGHEFVKMLESFGVQSVATMVKNPQANAILKRVDQITGNVLRMFDFIFLTLEPDGSPVDLFADFLAAVAFGICISRHVVLNASSTWMAFKRDKIFSTQYITTIGYRGRLEEHNQAIVVCNNICNHKLRVQHDNKIDDYVLV